MVWDADSWGPCGTADLRSQLEKLSGDIDVRCPPWSNLSEWSIAIKSLVPVSQNGYRQKLPNEIQTIYKWSTWAIRLQKMPSTGNRIDIQKAWLCNVAYSGILHMKASARSSVWWPGFNPEIEKKAEERSKCQTGQGKWLRSLGQSPIFLSQELEVGKNVLGLICLFCR